jgi:hypothetical protein
MMLTAKVKSYLRGLLLVAIGSATCASLSGCLLAAAGAGAAGGYMIGKESEKDRHTDVHIHETHVEEPPPPVD